MCTEAVLPLIKSTTPLYVEVEGEDLKVEIQQALGEIFIKPLIHQLIDKLFANTLSRHVGESMNRTN